MEIKMIKNLCEKKLGIAEKDLFSDMELRDFLDDDLDQVELSDELYESFKRELKGKKYYVGSERELWKFFQHICTIYNVNMDDADKYGALTYFEKVVELVDTLEISDITSLSFEQLNQLLDADTDKEVLTVYNKILKNRKLLTNDQFSLFKDMVKSAKTKYSASELKKVFDHLCTIYNENTVLQDNVNRDEFLKTFSHLSSKKVLSMRMIEIIEMFKIQVNVENINEARLLVNDLNSNGVCLDY